MRAEREEKLKGFTDSVSLLKLGDRVHPVLFFILLWVSELFDNFLKLQDSVISAIRRTVLRWHLTEAPRLLSGKASRRTVI